MRLPLYVFDLDGTVADSSHRKATRTDGSLDLDHWRENSTPEKVAADSLLPLSDTWKMAQAAGHSIAICTARVMSKPDWEWLEDHGLSFHYAMSRREGDTRPDDLLKENKILDLLFKLAIPPVQYGSVILYDDNHDVLTMARRIGIASCDAVKRNALLQALRLTA